jgi:pimeloyl-ACP methyl ester carboxylesterase
MTKHVQIRSGRASLAAEAGGSGPAVVCLHAGVADRRSWRPVAPHLVAHHRVVAYDRRGFGDTGAVQEPYDDVADLIAVLDHFAIDAAVLVGNSQGGRVALEAALAHPARVRGLVLVGAFYSGGPYGDDGPEVTAIEARIAEAEARGDLDEVNRLEAHLWLDGPLSPEGRVGGAARELFLDMNGRALALDAEGVGERVPRDDVWPRLPEIAVPVAIVEGSLDVPGSMAVAETAAARIPGAALHVIDGVAHLPGLEEPDVLADLIARLARAVSG